MLGGRCEMATSNHKSYSEFGSVMRAGLTALCLTTALCTPALAGGRGGISVSIGGTVGGVGGTVGGVGGSVGGVGGAVGGIGGSVGSISSGGGLSVGGVTIGTGGGGGTPSFTGSNFFSGGVDFGNGAARGASRRTEFAGQRVNKRANRDAAIAAKVLKSKSEKAVARAGKDSVKAQAAAKKVLPEFATQSRTINIGGDQGVTAKVNPASGAQIIVGGNDPANPAVNITTQTGDGSSAPLVTTTGQVLDAPGASTGSNNAAGRVASTEVSILEAA